MPRAPTSHGPRIAIDLRSGRSIPELLDIDGSAAPRWAATGHECDRFACGTPKPHAPEIAGIDTFALKIIYTTTGTRTTTCGAGVPPSSVRGRAPSS